MVDPLAAPGSSPRTRIHRLPEKAVHDRAAAYAILDSGLLAYVALVVDDEPVLSPLGYGRLGDELVLHGSRASRLMKALASGTPACVNVTLLDGLVMARSLFESSMHYRSVTAHGSARELAGEEVLPALRALSERLLPHRWEEARHPTAPELKATITVAFPLDDIAVKVSSGPPIDTDEDRDDPRIAALWAGTIPILRSWGSPVADEATPPGVASPAYIASWPPPGQT